jgi:hypothetical protein
VYTSAKKRLGYIGLLLSVRSFVRPVVTLFRLSDTLLNFARTGIPFHIRKNPNHPPSKNFPVLIKFDTAHFYTPAIQREGVYSICPFVCECFPHCLCLGRVMVNATVSCLYCIAVYDNYIALNDKVQK